MNKGNNNRNFSGLRENELLNKDLAKIFDSYREPKSYYNCVVPIDGNLDSIFRLFLLKEVYKMRPLVATFNTFYSTTRKYNLYQSLEAFDVDQIMYTPRKSIIKKLLQKFSGDSSFLNSGDLAMQIRTSMQYKIPLLVWTPEIIKSESLKISDGITHIDKPFLKKLNEVFSPSMLIDNDISLLDTIPYHFPEPDDLFIDLKAIQFEKYYSNDKQAQSDFLINEYGFKNVTSEDTGDVFWYIDPDLFNISIDEVNPDGNTLVHKYDEVIKNSEKGKPIFKDQIKYCMRCCWPETSEGVVFDEMGMCQACRSSEQKMHINWIERDKKLKEILKEFGSKDGSYYDCLVPISGGKDSIFQLYYLKQLQNIKPLAATFSHNWYGPTGIHNLKTAIEVFDVDHVMFNPRRSVINKAANKSLYMIGDSCWHCHAGVGSFPLQVAVKYKVHLLVWGESIAEEHGLATYEKPIAFDREYFTLYSARFYAEEFVDENLSLYDLQPYILPDKEEIISKQVRGIHLGDYMFWDHERQMEFVRDNFDWREDHVEGTYKGYKSVECRMAGVHDYTKFLKRGFGRATDHVSQDVRCGLLTREEGFELAKIYDTERPTALNYYEKITGYTDKDIEDILKKKRDDKARDLP